jgi:PAS domain S-box-containing protein
MSAPDRTPIQVLHVDDEPDVADLAATFLERERERIEVRTATSADEELDRLTDATSAAELEIDCIVSDYNMPRMDGLEFLERVREAFPDLPFILFTGKGSEEIASEAITAGVTDYLNKGTGTDQYTLLANRIANTVSQYRAEHELQRSTARNRQYRTAIETVDDAVYVLDDEGRFEFVNEAFAELTGYDAADVIGSGVECIKDPGTVEMFEDLIREMLSAGTHDTTVEFELKTDDGERIACEDHLALRLADGEFEGVAGAIRDVSERHESERYRRRLYEITADETLSIEETIQRTLELGAEYLGMENGFLTRIEDGTQRIVNSHGPHEELQPGSECPLPESYCRKTIEMDEPMTVLHADDTGWHDDPAYERFGLETYIGAKITVGGELYGTVCFADRSPRETDFSTVELAFVDLLSQGVAGAVQRADHHQELEAAQARFRSLTRNTTLGVVTIDEQSTVQFANTGIEELFGYAPAELVGESLGAIIPNRLESAHFEAIERYLDTGDRRLDWEWIELPARHRDGSELQVGVSFGEYVVDGDQLFTGVVRNIGELKQREQDLRATTDLLSTLLSNLSAGILVEDAERDVLFANDSFCSMFGIDAAPSELEGVDCARAAEALAGQFVEPTAFAGRIPRILDERIPIEGETLEREDGRIFERSYVPVSGENGERNLWVYRDVTDRLQRERTLEALYDRTRKMMHAGSRRRVCEITSETIDTVLDHPFNGVWLHDEDEHVLRPVAWSDQADELFDEQPVYTSEAGGLSWEAFETGTERIYDDLTTGAAVNPETAVRSEMVLPLGRHGVLNIGSTASDAFDQNDIALARLLATTVEAALDRAERETLLRNRQRQLEQQNDRLDEFASTISHDLRNPLTVAEGRLELLGEESDSEHIEPIGRALDRMDALIEDALALARQGLFVSDPEPVDLVSVVEDALATVGETPREVVLDGELPTVRADPERLQTLLENLLRNAVEHGSTNPPSQAQEDAVEHGSTSSQASPDDAVEHGSTNPPSQAQEDPVDHGGNDVTVTIGTLDDEAGFFVADDGPGVPREERSDVFEYGYSSAENGTGLGLAIVNNIVEAHGWSIMVAETDSGGARFEITTASEPDQSAAPSSTDRRAELRRS